MIRFAENLNKMIAAGLGGALEAPSTEVAVGHRVRYMDASGPVAFFETNIAAPIRSLRVDMRPIQEGSGDPSPDNIRPISGRGSVTVVWTGKNMFNPDTITMGSFVRAGSVSETNPLGSLTANNSWNSSDYIPVIPSTQYTQIIPAYSAAGAAGMVFFEDKTVESAISGISIAVMGQAKYSFTTPANCHYIRTSYRNYMISDDFPYPIMARGDADNYEPFDGASATTLLGETVYSGTLDMVSGKLTVNMAIIESYNGETLPGEWISDRDVYTPGTSPTIGAQVCYTLATPTEIALTPAQLSTLAGENNIWSDAGDVTLEYPYYEETEGY